MISQLNHIFIFYLHLKWFDCFDFDWLHIIQSMGIFSSTSAEGITFIISDILILDTALVLERWVLIDIYISPAQEVMAFFIKQFTVQYLAHIIY